MLAPLWAPFWHLFPSFWHLFFEHGFSNDLSSIWALIMASFLCFFDEFPVRAPTLQNLKKLLPLQ
jgi:hypothetical protein